jgi:hypothetical protein
MQRPRPTVRRTTKESLRKARIRSAVLVGILGVLTLMIASPAEAAQARHLTIEIHDSFQDDFLTDVCGTVVLVTIDATLNVTLQYNQQGLLVKEIDPAGGGTTSFEAPETGGSFSYPFNTAVIDYGAGAAIGSTFTMKIVGLFGHATGSIPSDAGQVVVTGFVSGFDENGSPQLEFTDLLLQRGNVESAEDIIAAMCSSLGA